MDSLKKPYQYASREELAYTLQLKEGVLPLDIYGLMYLTSMCGSLNSDGLPIPQKHPGETEENPEYGTPQLAGDGMLFKIDFNCTGEVRIKTCISKPPCYFADLATDRTNSPAIDPKFKDYGFKSGGMTRTTMQLGFRNELSVAVIPMQFHQDKYPRLLATFDAGRPWEFNTETLSLITPLGKYSEWLKGTPPGLTFPFYIIQNSAHPSFDAKTKELFTVNYVQEKTIGYQIAFFLLLLEHRDEVQNFLEEKARLYAELSTSKENSSKLKAIVDDITLLFEKPEAHERFKSFMNAVLDKHKVTKKTITPTPAPANEVFLMSWDGKQEPFKKWRVTDENGQDLVIEECMHQTALTEDYILLSDSSFKFSADLLINNPFPDNPAIDSMFRLLLNKKSPVDMALYVIRRKDLKNTTTVQAKKISLPEDCIHFVANYTNPKDILTLYTINNNSVCVAEWIRPYDTLKFSGAPVYPELVGLPAMSAMDLNSLSKYEILLDSETIKRLDCVTPGGEPGNVTKPHTWEVCLLTYRDMIAPNKIVEEIKDLFVFSAGLNSQRLTTFMFDLFKDLPGKIIPTEEVLEYTQKGVTQSLFRLNTDDMTIQDSFMPDFNAEIRSLQFIPRRVERKGVPYSMNGYIVCIMMVGESTAPNAPATINYTRELWIFEADNLSKGPVCKLTHPDLSYAFTLHSTWIEEARQEDSGYQISIREDFSDPQSIFPDVQKNIKEFFEKYIYPHFEPKNN